MSAYSLIFCVAKSVKLVYIPHSFLYLLLIAYHQPQSDLDGKESILFVVFKYIQHSDD